MKFGPVKPAQAVGAILAHSLYLSGTKVPKGARLTADMVRDMEAASFKEITVARLEPGDVGEDEAAQRVARAVAGSGVTVKAPVRGRTDLVAEADGLLMLTEDKVRGVNDIEEAITLATLSPYQVVRSGDCVGTVKIIPYAASGSAVERAEEQGQAALSIAPFRIRRVGLISTLTPNLKDGLVAKTRNILSARLARLGNEFTHDATVDHTVDAVRAAIEAALGEELDILLIMGGAATVDRRDVLPAALEKAGGEVLRLGMPAEPGNLLVLGAHAGRPVIGLPGCVRSPALNGFDWVLERLIAGLDVTPSDIIGMGVGGYLKGMERSS